jgi:hypothetical protein
MRALSAPMRALLLDLARGTQPFGNNFQNVAQALERRGLAAKSLGRWGLTTAGQETAKRVQQTGR